MEPLVSGWAPDAESSRLAVDVACAVWRADVLLSLGAGARSALTAAGGGGTESSFVQQPKRPPDFFFLLVSRLAPMLASSLTGTSVSEWNEGIEGAELFMEPLPPATGPDVKALRGGGSTADRAVATGAVLFGAEYLNEWTASWNCMCFR